MNRRDFLGRVAAGASGLLGVWPARKTFGAEKGAQRLLYVAVPGIRNYLEYGGHGVLVFDIEKGYRWVRRISSGGLQKNGSPSNVKGICVSVALQRLYVSTIGSLMAFDLGTDRLEWEREYDGGCDRMAISPDGMTIYLPSFEKDHWHVVDAQDGTVRARVEPVAGAHNTNYGLNGREAYLAGLRSRSLAVTDTATHKILRQVGPFSAPIRPFTVNGAQTLGFMCVNHLLGFEVANLKSGKVVARYEVAGFEKGKVARHGCPSHGIGLTPDEREVWLCDGFNRRLHIFELDGGLARQVASVSLREEPGWVSFSIDGRYAYASTGEVIEVATRQIVAVLTDEHGAAVHSEKLLEIDFEGGRATRAGCQFGIGQVVQKAG